jgi:8-oxo-dGTP diphosphatase
MPYTFCPHCATRLEPHRTEQRDLLACPACGWVFYNNSAPCVGVIVTRRRDAAGVGPSGMALPFPTGWQSHTPALQAHEVLLVKRAREPFKGWWDIPGGFLESGEHPADGAKREILEETGLVIEPTEVLGFFMDAYGPDEEPTLNICYLGTVTGGEEKAGSDAEGLGWFGLDGLPERIAFSWEREALEAVSRRMKL